MQDGSEISHGRKGANDASRGNNASVFILNKFAEKGSFKAVKTTCLLALFVSVHSIVAAAEITPKERAEHERAIFVYSSSVIPANPKDARSYQIRGAAYFALGQNELALADYSQAIRFAPNFSDHYLDRAWVYWELKDYARAEADGRQALAVSPNNAAACNFLAWCLIYCPEKSLRNEATAVQLAQRACSLTGNRKPAFLETLAAALKQLEAARNQPAQHSTNEFKSLEDLLKQRSK